MRICLKKYYMCFVLVVLFLTGCKDNCSKEMLETVPSPDKNNTIVVYLKNCGATVSWIVTANLCDSNNNCKEIYNCYREHEAKVYWIDNENIFINNKKLNVYKDYYDWKKDDNFEENLYSNES